MTAGLIPRAALALAGAGFHSLADLEGVTRSRLAAIPGVGPGSLTVIERLLSQPFPDQPPRGDLPSPWPEIVWRQRGIPPEAAITFVQVGMTVERLKTITREELLALFRVGPATVRACGLLIGKDIPSVRKLS